MTLSWETSTVAGVGAAGELPDLAVQGVELGLGVGGRLVGLGDGSLLVVQLDLGVVDLLGDDLELVAGVGDELGGLLRGWRRGRRGGGAREDGEGQRGGGAEEETGADPAESPVPRGRDRAEFGGHASVQREGSPRAAALRFFLCNRLPS